MPKYRRYKLADLEPEGGLKIQALSLLEITTTKVPTDVCMIDLQYRIIFES